MGLAVLDAVAGHYLPDVQVVAASDEPGAMLEAWTDSDVAVVVDSAMGHGRHPGRIGRWTPGDDRPAVAAAVPAAVQAVLTELAGRVAAVG